MKVLKRGKKPSNLSSRISCQYCRALLLVTLADAKTSGADRDGAYHVFRCPECSSGIWVADSVFRHHNEEDK